MTRLLPTVLALLAVTACGNDDSAEPTPGSGTARSEQSEESPPPPGRREEHDVFRLADNRLLAHLQRGGGLVVVAGSAGLYKYARFGVPALHWKVGQERDGVRVALPDEAASLSVPLTAEQAEHAEVVAVRVHSTGKRRVTVSVNGKPASDSRAHVVDIAPGWQTVAIPCAQGRFREGTNVVKFRFRDKTSAFEWIQIGGEVPLEAGQLPEIFAADGEVISLPDGYALVYYVQVPQDGHLVADVAGDGCEVRVQARDHDGAVVTGALRGARAGVDLGALAGRVVRLELTASGCASARLDHAALTIPGPTPTFEKGPPPKHIIFWVMDALRGDKVRVATPGARAEVPTFERLAETGTSFRQHYVQGNESQTSHSSFWTSLYPVNHGVVVAGQHKHYQLSKSFPTFITLLGEAGFHNLGITANGMVHEWTGYTRGLHSFRNLMRDGTGRRLHFNVPAELIFNLAFEQLGDSYRDRFLLFIGTIDTHKPWVAREPWISKYDPEPYEGAYERAATGANLGIKPGTMRCTIKPEPRDLQRIVAIYDSDISYQDSVVRQMLDKLAELGIADETFLIITADHGEELWEYPGLCGHAGSSRESLVRVPLILHYPPTIGSGYVDEGVEGVDLLPTILDVMRMEPLESAQGESLVPISHGVGRGYPRAVYSSKHEYGHTMRVGVWKIYIGKKGIPALYDVSVDRDERRDLADIRHFERQFASDPFSLFLILRRDWKKRHWGVVSNMRPAAWRDLDGPRAAEE